MQKNFNIFIANFIYFINSLNNQILELIKNIIFLKHK